MKSKTNLRYPGVGILSDDNRTVFKDLKKISEAEKTQGLKMKPTECKFLSLVTSHKDDEEQFYHLIKKSAARSKHQRKLNLSSWVHRSTQGRRQTHWRRKYLN